MELYYILYRLKGAPPKYYLLFYVGTRNGKLIGVDSSRVTSKEKQAIRNSAFASLSLEKRIKWLKDNCPNAYANGFKQFKVANMKVISKHSINKGS